MRSIAFAEGVDRGDRDLLLSANHYISNSYVCLDGKLFDRHGFRRYLDRFECRDGAWKIAHRVTTGDWDRIDAVTFRTEGDFVKKLTCGMRDRTDPSFSYFKVAT